MAKRTLWLQRASRTASLGILIASSGCDSAAEPVEGPRVDGGVDTGAETSVPLADSAADATSDSPVQTDGDTSDAISCLNVCCECDYGVLPPEVAEQCCSADAAPVDAAPDAVPADAAPVDDAADAVSCEGVCCQCDYGMPPPPQCCP